MGDDVFTENKIVAESRLNKINELFREFKIGANEKNRQILEKYQEKFKALFACCRNGGYELLTFACYVGSVQPYNLNTRLCFFRCCCYMMYV